MRSMGATSAVSVSRAARLDPIWGRFSEPASPQASPGVQLKHPGCFRAVFELTSERVPSHLFRVFHPIHSVRLSLSFSLASYTSTHRFPPPLPTRCRERGFTLSLSPLFD